MTRTNPSRVDHNLPPSERTPVKYRPAPNGAVDVWCVMERDASSPNHFPHMLAAVLDKDFAFKCADLEWLATRGNRNRRVWVDHKAGVMIDDRVHFISMNPVRIQPIVGELPTDNMRKMEAMQSASTEVFRD